MYVRVQGVSGEVIVGKLLESSDPRHGYNAATGEYVDMISAGIIDPTKVVRTALQDASSVAALMVGMDTTLTTLRLHSGTTDHTQVTTEAAVADLPEEPHSHGGAGAGRGGMGGMVRQVVREPGMTLI